MPMRIEHPKQNRMQVKDWDIRRPQHTVSSLHFPFRARPPLRLSPMPNMLRALKQKQEKSPSQQRCSQQDQTSTAMIYAPSNARVESSSVRRATPMRPPSSSTSSPLVVPPSQYHLPIRFADSSIPPSSVTAAAQSSISSPSSSPPTVATRPQPSPSPSTSSKSLDDTPTLPCRRCLN